MASVSLGKPIINEMRWLGQEYSVYCAAVTFVRQLNSKFVVPMLRIHLHHDNNFWYLETRLIRQVPSIFNGLSSDKAVKGNFLPIKNLNYCFHALIWYIVGHFSSIFCSMFYLLIKCSYTKSKL